MSQASSNIANMEARKHDASSNPQAPLPDLTVTMPASGLRDIRKVLVYANAHSALALVDAALATAHEAQSGNLERPASTGTPSMEARKDTAIYIDAKHGTLPMTALIDSGNQLLRMSKDGQRVIIQHRSDKLTLAITLTRVSMGKFTEEYAVESLLSGN